MSDHPLLQPRSPMATAHSVSLSALEPIQSPEWRPEPGNATVKQEEEGSSLYDEVMKKHATTEEQARLAEKIVRNLYPDTPTVAHGTLEPVSHRPCTTRASYISSFWERPGRMQWSSSGTLSLVVHHTCYVLQSPQSLVHDHDAHRSVIEFPVFLPDPSPTSQLETCIRQQSGKKTIAALYHRLRQSMWSQDGTFLASLDEASRVFLSSPDVSAEACFELCLPQAIASHRLSCIAWLQREDWVLLGGTLQGDLVYWTLEIQADGNVQCLSTSHVECSTGPIAHLGSSKEAIVVGTTDGGVYLHSNSQTNAQPSHIGTLPATISYIASCDPYIATITDFTVLVCAHDTVCGSIQTPSAIVDAVWISHEELMLCLRNGKTPTYSVSQGRNGYNITASSSELQRNIESASMIACKQRDPHGKVVAAAVSPCHLLLAVAVQYRSEPIQEETVVHLMPLVQSIDSLLHCVKSAVAAHMHSIDAIAWSIRYGQVSLALERATDLLLTGIDSENDVDVQTANALFTALSSLFFQEESVKKTIKRHLWHSWAYLLQRHLRSLMDPETPCANVLVPLLTAMYQSWPSLIHRLIPLDHMKRYLDTMSQPPQPLFSILPPHQSSADSPIDITFNIITLPFNSPMPLHMPCLLCPSFLLLHSLSEAVCSNGHSFPLCLNSLSIHFPFHTLRCSFCGAAVSHHQAPAPRCPICDVRLLPYGLSQ